VFGIGVGGGYSRHEHQEKHNVQNNGAELVLDDGKSSIRVIGFVAQKNSDQHKAIMDPLYRAQEKIVQPAKKR
jgi:hypothetical protein